MSWVNTSPLVKIYTLQEFWDLPEPPDHSKLELIAGVVYLTPPPGYTHDNAVSRLTFYRVTGTRFRRNKNLCRLARYSVLVCKCGLSCSRVPGIQKHVRNNRDDNNHSSKQRPT